MQNRFLDDLEQQIGYRFNNRLLPLQALTHKSFSNEQSGDPVPHNERLEFLGDAVLELAVSDRVFKHYPDVPEGGLTKIRSEVVSEKGLLKVSRRLNLGDGLRLGKGEEKSGGRKKPSLLSDALEALLGAVFCDGGFEAACQVTSALFADQIELMAGNQYGTDYKTCLQEALQARFNKLPQYTLIQVAGPDHQRVFTMEVRFNDELLGVGEGSSKKIAEQQAATKALKHPLLSGEGEVAPS